MWNHYVPLVTPGKGTMACPDANNTIFMDVLSNWPTGYGTGRASMSVLPKHANCWPCWGCGHAKQSGSVFLRRALPHILPAPSESLWGQQGSDATQNGQEPGEGEGQKWAPARHSGDHGLQFQSLDLGQEEGLWLQGNSAALSLDV